MKIYQPMLFVGLGGTGCKVGAEFEKRLREELCGPDGTRLQASMPDSNLLPYQLPSCLQFVYADLSSTELQRVRREVVPGREHDQAAQKTMHLITDLVPARLGNSAEVAQSLRINADEETIGWLPSKESDPLIGPLIRGAGQLPTVGRCVLFETIRRNPDTALLGITEALEDINESAGELYMISGKRTQRVDPVIVFVVYSVAGGTGGGVFYDYLHLIGHLMQRGQKQAEIYPLVLMPSAFEGGPGGGRPAELNAGAALVDLFRLIDDQNAQGSPDELDARGTHGTVSVRYPQLEQVQLLPNTVQTAFLFGRPVGGVRRDDLNRSMVSLMISLIGAGPTEEADDEDAVNRPYQSFADGFINSKVDRHAVAETGVGRRGVTTSAVAALTTPLLELTDVVSSHFLANAVRELLVPPGAAEANKPHIRQFVNASGLDRLLEAAPTRIPPVGNPVGYTAVLTALTERANAMSASIDRGGEALAGPVATLAQDFHPTEAATVLLRSVDLFRLQRIVFGHRDLTDPLDRQGFRSLLEGWRIPPAAPAGLNPAAPPVPQNLPKKLTKRLRITDEPAQAVLRLQDSWYAWQTRRLWNSAWNDSHRLWSRPWQAFVEELRAVYDQFTEHALNDPQQFDQRSKDLYKTRVGVTYLLPPEDRGLEGFYQTVLTRLKQDHEQHLGPNAHEGHVLNLLLGHDGWAAAYELGRRDPEAAVAAVRQKVKEAVTEVVRPSDRGRPALVPHMADLLANAVQRRDNHVTETDLNRFRQKLAELVPGGFAPDGHAPLKVLFTYPAGQENPDIERFLRREVPLPVDLLGEPEFRAVQADSMVVVLTRSSMGVTEVPELRRVVKLWSEAQRKPHPQDSLAWRRRLNQDTGYLLMDERDRQQVLHRLLCAAWDGKIVVAGDPASPDFIRVDIGSKDSIQMKLELTPLGALSSWASVLQAYENWILTDDNATRRGLAARLMSSVPAHADRAPAPPAPEFTTIVDLAEPELLKIKEAEQSRVLSRDTQLAVFRQFWSQALRAALNQRLGITAKSLLDLREQVDVAHGLGG
ncbi:MAG TPA: tubulin-like doman-containing protein [Actinophytocola sp.]|uniref:tubulin-like doman-containing protein n=1 Tax=Actinophytocola sp. TaxID=1872138 RepID=UPI002DDD1687|nr:tubulin-like doman-containing protein [Actinophytocola sp.]HEV2781153.1 tubulin-like doman-containing protein [Actinophytocola sp.]